MSEEYSMSDEELKKHSNFKTGYYSMRYDAQTIKKIEELAGQRFKWGEIADYFGITHRTLCKHKKENPEINMAYRRGKSKTLSFVVSALFKQISEGNSSSTQFYLRKFDNWSDEIHHEESEEDENEVQDKIETTDPIEASKRYQQIMTRGLKK